MERTLIIRSFPQQQGTTAAQSVCKKTAEKFPGSFTRLRVVPGAKLDLLDYWAITRIILNKSTAVLRKSPR
jgi:hypothetical protein